MAGKRSGLSETFEPHQLDCDWRFSPQSQTEIAERLAGAKSVALLGCPTVAAPLERSGQGGILIERNPNYEKIRGFEIVRADLRFYSINEQMVGAFDAVLADSPWYVDELLRWVDVGLSLAKLGGSVFFILWPESTRPTAREERESIGALHSSS